MTDLENRFNGPIPHYLKAKPHRRSDWKIEIAEHLYRARQLKKFAEKKNLCLSFTNKKHTQH